MSLRGVGSECTWMENRRRGEKTPYNVTMMCNINTVHACIYMHVYIHNIHTYICTSPIYFSGRPSFESRSLYVAFSSQKSNYTLTLVESPLHAYITQNFDETPREKETKTAGSIRDKNTSRMYMYAGLGVGGRGEGGGSCLTPSLRCM